MRQSNAYKYGVQGEEIASDYLQEIGFEILNCRFKTKYGEIDLVAKKDDLLVFVEVKSRNAPMHLELINKTKIDRSCNAASAFLAENPHYSEYQMRFDLIIVINCEIQEHITNAWSCDYL